MNYIDFNGLKLSNLGLGCMRFPSSDVTDPHAPINYVEAQKIIDAAFDAGINYFDTAPMYNDCDSERCLGECLKKYPRDSYYLASKFYYDLDPDYERVFASQLERLQTDHIDFYLIHSLGDSNYKQYLECGVIPFLEEQRKQGKIRYLGFSSHASVNVLEEFADSHPWDFVLLQLNYYDWWYGMAAKEYQAMADRNIPVFTMESVRGGSLADLTPRTNELLKQAHPDWSIPAWAFRFLKGKPQIKVILSGASDTEQIADNAKTFADGEGLSVKDEELLHTVYHIFKDELQVPCTACRYCTGECPMEINIPEYMAVYNRFRTGGKDALEGYSDIASRGKATDCTGCGACMKHCPQGIDIPGTMAALAKLV